MTLWRKLGPQRVNYRISGNFRC